MATPDSAMRKYGDKTGPGSVAAAKYAAAKGRMVANWTTGLRNMGVTPGPLSTRAYQEGIARAEYRGGDPSKWLRNWQSGMAV